MLVLRAHATNVSLTVQHAFAADAADPWQFTPTPKNQMN